MGIAEESLHTRNEGLYRLREIDAELRELHPPTPDNDASYSVLEDERQCIAEALVVMNCEPWPFDPELDNSFVDAGVSDGS